MLYVLQWGSLCRRAGSDVGFKNVKHDTVQLYKMCAQWYKTLFHHWSQFFLEFLPFLISQVLEALVLYEMVCLWYDANEPRLLEAYPENPTLLYATSVCSHDDLGFVRVVSHLILCGYAFSKSFGILSVLQVRCQRSQTRVLHGSLCPKLFEPRGCCSTSSCVMLGSGFVIRHLVLWQTVVRFTVGSRNCASSRKYFMPKL